MSTEQRITKGAISAWCDVRHTHVWRYCVDLDGKEVFSTESRYERDMFAAELAEYAAKDSLRHRKLFCKGRPVSDMSRDELLVVVEYLFEAYERMQANFERESQMRDSCRKARRR